MCKSASLILTKDGCFHDPDGDSHQRIICLHKLHSDGVRGPNIVPVEITPPDGDYSQPLESWIYTTDCGNDLLPDWYNADPYAAESRARAGLVTWAADHIQRGSTQVVEGGQTRIALGDCVQTVNGGTGRAFNNATQTVNGGMGWAFDNATQTVNGGAGEAFDNATQVDNRRKS